MLKLLAPRLAVVLCLFVGASSARGAVYLEFDAPNYNVIPGGTVNLSLYLVADDGDEVVTATGLTADPNVLYDSQLLTDFGLFSVGVTVNYSGILPANPAFLASGAANANPSFIADYDLDSAPGFQSPSPSQAGPSTDLYMEVDPSRFSFVSGFGTDLGEAIISFDGTARILVGTFAFTVPEASNIGDVTTISASDLSLLSETLSGDPFDPVFLDDFLGNAEATISTTPEPATCVAWLGFLLMGTAARVVRRRF